MTRPKLVLSEVRRGPDCDRRISGVCSTCGDILLERLDEDEGDGERLRVKLDKVFAQHVADYHSKEATE